MARQSRADVVVVVVVVVIGIRRSCATLVNRGCGGGHRCEPRGTWPPKLKKFTNKHRSGRLGISTFGLVCAACARDPPFFLVQSKDGRQENTQKFRHCGTALPPTSPAEESRRHGTAPWPATLRTPLSWASRLPPRYRPDSPDAAADCEPVRYGASMRRLDLGSCRCSLSRRCLLYHAICSARAQPWSSAPLDPWAEASLSIHSHLVMGRLSPPRPHPWAFALPHTSASPHDR